MGSVSLMNVSQVRIYPAPGFPLYRFLRTRRGAEFLAEKYGFTNFGMVSEDEYSADEGVFSLPGDQRIALEKFSFGIRRTIFQGWAGSVEVSEAYDSVLEDVCREIGHDDELPTPVVFTQETTLITELGFDASRLLSEPLADFTENALPRRLANQYATAGTRLQALRFRVSFDPSSSNLADHGISLSQKPFTLEPVTQAPIESRLYFTQSPCDSETHLALVREVEDALCGRK